MPRRRVAVVVAVGPVGMTSRPWLPQVSDGGPSLPNPSRPMFASVPVERSFWLVPRVDGATCGMHWAAVVAAVVVVDHQEHPRRRQLHLLRVES